MATDGNQLSLGLAFGVHHAPTDAPAKVLRQIDLDWFYQEGCSFIFPDAWEAFEKAIPPAERGSMIEAYYKRLTDPDPRVHLPAAEAWSVWEGTTLSLIEDPARPR